MSRRQRNGDDPEPKALNTPFRKLRKLVQDVPDSIPRKPPRRAAAPPQTAAEDPDELFFAATADVVRLPAGQSRRSAGPPPLPPVATSRKREDDEALAELSDLVAGHRPFELSDTDEYAEGWVKGLDPRVVRRLRDGEFTCRSHLDLHGLTAEEAKGAVRQFLMRALRAGHRCVLVVHGRGRNSPDRRSVLKEALKSWLSRGDLSRVVLAFASARPCDGGAGATYVLLRRERRPRKPFETLTGAKS